ncbi:MAG: SUMF1/EgtB/PvdO family nonheme iron enzyme [Deltaproteobacteria bacterium]|nr:SUMF1/EgtB/PvdO family nonheme iron enzyme [Deltaproteobacteria bacterium]
MAPTLSPQDRAQRDALLRRLDARIVDAQRAFANGDFRATANHVRSAAEASCRAALLARGHATEGETLDRLIQLLQSKNTGGLIKTISDSLGDIKNKGNSASHDNDDQHQDPQATAFTVLIDLQPVVRWLFADELKLSAPANITRFLAAKFGHHDEPIASSTLPRSLPIALVILLLMVLSGFALSHVSSTPTPTQQLTARRAPSIEHHPDADAPAIECLLPLQGSAHLRPREMCESEGPEMGTPVPALVLGVGQLRRGSTRMVHIRLRDREASEGWVFARESELVGACPSSWTAPSEGVPCRQRATPSAGCATSQMHVNETSFQMGSSVVANASPEHRVAVSAHCIDRSKVTVREYLLCVAAGICSPAERSSGDRRACNATHSDRAGLEVNCVTWHQAKTFCDWAGGRLATEAEWELAARTQAAHVRGLLDGVAEWVEDGFELYQAGAQENPIGSPTSNQRTVRGGSLREPAIARVAFREGLSPGLIDPTVGFRCAGRR